MEIFLFIVQTLLSSIVAILILNKFYFPKLLKTIDSGNKNVASAVEEVLAGPPPEVLPPLTDVDVVSFRPISPCRHVVVFKKGDLQWKITTDTPEDLYQKDLPEIKKYFLEKSEARYH
jgi:hypothetical protein